MQKTAIIHLSVVIATARQTIKTVTRTRRRKAGGNSGYQKCNICHGTGRIKKKKK